MSKIIVSFRNTNNLGDEFNKNLIWDSNQINKFVGYVPIHK